jgi:hypothetical protein
MMFMTPAMVLEHFNVVDGADRDQAQVGGRRTLEHARRDMQVAGAVAPLAVHQDQGVVGIEPAQLR